MAFIEGIPTVVLQLDQPRTLGFTMGAMRRIKEELGTLDLPMVDGRIPLDRAIEIMPVYIWACLDAKDRTEVSVEQLEDMMHPGNLPEITDAVTKLFKASSPEASTDAGPTQEGPRLAAG